MTQLPWQHKIVNLRLGALIKLETNDHSFDTFTEQMHNWLRGCLEWFPLPNRFLLCDIDVSEQAAAAAQRHCFHYCGCFITALHAGLEKFCCCVAAGAPWSPLHQLPLTRSSSTLSPPPLSCFPSTPIVMFLFSQRKHFRDSLPLLNYRAHFVCQQLKWLDTPLKIHPPGVTVSDAEAASCHEHLLTAAFPGVWENMPCFWTALKYLLGYLPLHKQD